MQRTHDESTVHATEAMFLRIRSVVRMTGLGRSTIYRLIADDKFPRPVKLGPRAVAWRRSDLQSWSDARPVSVH